MATSSSEVTPDCLKILFDLIRKKKPYFSDLGEIHRSENELTFSNSKLKHEHIR